MTVTGVIIFTGIFLCQISRGRHLYFEDIFSNVNQTEFVFAEQKPEPKVCLTETCKQTAKEILENINPEIDPCEDFYNYACDGWMEKHQIPATENRWNQFDVLEKKLDSQIHQLLEAKNEEKEPEMVKMAKKLYRACMNKERIEERGLNPLLNLLQEFGGWPIASSTWKESSIDWQKLVSDVSRKLGINTILAIWTDIDRKNTSRHILIVSESILGLPRYTLTDYNSTYVGYYGTYMAEAAILVRRATGQPIQPFKILSESYDVIKFQMDLAKISRSREDEKSADGNYNVVTLRKLQEWTNQKTHDNSIAKINWKSLIQNLVGTSNIEIKDDTPIDIMDWQFLSDLFNLIGVTPPRVIANYVLWRVVYTLGRDLNEDMRSLVFNIHSHLSGVQEEYPRWRECVSAAGQLSFAIGYMYVKEYFTEETKSKAVEMVKNIRTAFRKELSEVTWMDVETKKQAIEKADFMIHLVGYPSWFKNVTALEKYYKGLEVGENHFENTVGLGQFYFKQQWMDFNEETNREEWMMSPASIDAFYHPHQNSFLLPAGILQDPFFNKDQPEALNYGAVGAIVGHEITHGFDASGRQNDKLGNIKQWWSKEKEKIYLKKTVCFVKQYQNYRVPEMDELLNTKVTVDGELTLDENIADNGGLKAALRAYKAHMEKSKSEDSMLPGLDFTPEQLFYIGFARAWCETNTAKSLLGDVLEDPHSPKRFRVIGSVSNLDHFATTWRCKLGSNMNPTKKCTLW